MPCFFQDKLGFHLVVNGNGYLLIYFLLSKENWPKMKIGNIFFFSLHRRIKIKK
ncbi:unnamed protein product, partial [Staurois parvus]